MKKITKESIINDFKVETNFYENLKCKYNNIHYLSFEGQLGGFSPLGEFISDNKDIASKEHEIMQKLIDKKEVCSLYPQAMLTLYPIERVVGGNGYNVLLDKIDKNFEEILYLNDKVYRTESMYVDFAQGGNNLLDKDNYQLVLDNIQNLMKKSKVLKEILIEEIPF